VTANDETGNHGELTDRELDLLLTTANQELLEHIQATADPDRTLTSIMAMNTPASGHETPQALAALTIGMRSKAINLDRALGLASDRGRALDRAFALDLAGDLASARDLASDLASDFDRARHLALNIDGARARDLASDLNHARARALDLASDLASVRDLASTLDLDLARDLAHASTLAHDLARNLQTQQVDASGADLSDLEIGHMDALNGIIWTPQTTWPSNIAEQVRAQSEEIKPGVYQIRAGKTPDHSSLTSV
jgi:hypothetical protein